MLMGDDSIGDFLVGLQFRQSGADDVYFNVADGVGDISRRELVSIRGRDILVNLVGDASKDRPLRIWGFLIGLGRAVTPPLAAI